MLNLLTLFSRLSPHTRLVVLCSLFAFLAAVPQQTFAVEGSEASVSEQVTQKDFLGFWEVREPAGDTCYINIKQGGRLSCFWAGTSTRKIVKGTWELKDNQLIAKWETDQKDVISKLGENAIERKSYAPGATISGEPMSSTRGIRVDSRIPGSLTSTSAPDEREQEVAEDVDPTEAPALPMVNTFSGFWKVSQSTGFLGMGNDAPNFYLYLERNGKATVALRSWDVESGTEGKWKLAGGNVEIVWNNGRKDRLTPLKNGDFALEIFSRKRDFSDRPDGTQSAEKVNSVEAKRYFSAGELSKLTVSDIRGTWTPNDDSIDGRIEIEGWGNAYRYPPKVSQVSDPGKWRIQNDIVVITWVDGSKDVIRIGSKSFILESFEPSESITGKPYRTIPVARTPN